MHSDDGGRLQHLRHAAAIDAVVDEVAPHEKAQHGVDDNASRRRINAACFAREDRIGAGVPDLPVVVQGRRVNRQRLSDEQVAKT